MRIQEMIDALEKLKHSYPDHDVQIRDSNTIVDRVEICNTGVELVLRKAPKKDR